MQRIMLQNYHYCNLKVIARLQKRRFNGNKIERKDVVRPFQRIVRLYLDSNLQMYEMKDDSPFRHTLAGCEPTQLVVCRT